ncbi:endoglucanase E-4-like, partial [Babylonia areolata]|uniref:endoglucanase E-4-like n=1 Tax=Babylonia areolata TaxID=304850 RepID=UPI003FD50807
MDQPKHFDAALNLKLKTENIFSQRTADGWRQRCPVFSGPHPPHRPLPSCEDNVFPATTKSTTSQPGTTKSTTSQPGTTKSTTSQTEATKSSTTQRPNTSANARYDYSQALSDSLLFYLAQRSGPLPDDVISWRGDSAVNDGTQGPDGQWRDLSGGWYDAGDFLKLNFPMAGSTTVLLWGLLKFQDGYSASGQLARMREVVRWPLDYLLKSWDAQNQILYGQVGNVNLDHSFWGRPEDMTMDRPVYTLTPTAPGSDLAAETAAALAAGYLAFKDTDPTYASGLLQAARSLYTFADTYRGYYHESITDAATAYRSWGYSDELCWGAAWLYKATGETTYKSKAEANTGSVTSGEFSWDDKGVGCAKQQYADAVDTFTSKWRNGNGISVTPCGLSWLRQWGSLRYALNAAMISLMAAENGLATTANRDWALSQLNFALGDNKNQRSYVVGFGVNPPERPHHAASSCPSAPATCDWSNFNSPDPNPQVLYGALVGGPDVNGDYVDDRTDYVMNEVACDYNAGFQTVLAGLVSLESRGQLPTANPTCP